MRFLPWCFSTVLLDASPLADEIKLNGTLAQVRTGSFPEVVVSPDGGRLAFLARPTGQPDQLHVAPVDASTPPVEIATPSGAEVEQDLAFSLDGQWLLYRATVAGVSGLHRVRADGSQPSEPFHVATDVQSFALTTDDLGRAVVVFSSQPEGLHAQLLDAGGAIALLPGVSVLDFHVAVGSERVAFRTSGSEEPLWSAPLDGGSPAIQLTGTIVSNGGVFEYVITPDLSQVVFRGDLETAFQPALYSVPIDGSAPALKIGGPGVTANVVVGFELDPAGARAVFYHSSGLFVTPIDGSQPPLSLAPPPAGVLRGGRFDPTGSRVAYVSEQEVAGKIELYTVPADGSAPPVKGNAPLPATADVQGYVFAPDGRSLVYSADAVVDQRFELYLTPATGGPVRRCSGDVLGLGVQSSFAMTEDGAAIVYEAQTTVGPEWAAYRVPLRPTLSTAGHGAIRSLSGSVGPLQGTFAFRLADHGRRVILALEARDGSGPGLFTARVQAADPVRVSTPFPAGTAGDVEQYGATADGTRAIYVADELEDEVDELFSVPLDGSAAPIRLNPPMGPAADVVEFAVEPSGTRLVYRADAFDDDRFELLGVPQDGSLPAVSLSGPMTAGGDVFSMAIAPVGGRVAYLADQDTDGIFELFSVPIDGSAPRVRLHAALSGARDVESDFAFTADGTHVVFRAETAVNGRNDLVLAPADGSGPALILNSAGPGSSVSSFRLDPAGTFALYLSGEGTGTQQVFRVDLDAPGTAMQLSGPMVPGGNVTNVSDPARSYQLSPDGAWVVYRADQDTDGINELYAVPSDGSASSVKISHALNGTLIHGDVAISPDSQRVLYVADRDGLIGGSSLWSAPIDGSAPAIDLIPSQPSGPEVFGFQVSSDSARVAFRGNPGGGMRFDLFSVPVLGGVNPVRLNLVVPGDLSGVSQFAPTADGTAVLYVHVPAVGEPRQLFLAPIDHSGPAVLLDPDLDPPGSVQSFRELAGGTLLLLAEHETAGVFELFRDDLP